ncbi:MAG: CDP-glycerol glycerophosphotransferase family protein, partial [Firmicutes bacterium]|nr:CDP-glycerol glycerophosphotransferase family protein [Bacillota bacterium]
MSAAGKLKKSLGSCATIALGAKYVSHYNKNEIKENMIFYSSHYGAGMICSPYAIFTALMKSDEFDDYEHVWQINDPKERKILKKEYSGCQNVKFVGKNSTGYFDALTSAKYLVNDVTLPFYFTKKPGQIYVNTWHGIPLKTLGYDVPDGKYSVRNTVRNFLQTDYIISPCRFTTKIFMDSYKLRGVYKGKITECGHPRNDLILNTDRDYIVDKLSQRGTIIDDSKKIILYAPTWKGTDLKKAEKDIARYDEFCDYLSQHIDTEKYQILIKPHPAVYGRLSKEEMSSGKYISQCIHTDELLSITDVLVSDYSSLFFDFLLTDRPIIFYIPDVESYMEYRGVYFGPEELPGPYSCDMNDIAAWINDAESLRERYAETYDKMKAWSCEFDDGNVSKRVIDAVFHGDESQCRVVEDTTLGKKKRLLINGGSFAMNGVTTTLLTLLNLIDYDRYDITLLIVDDERSMPNIMKLNDNVRVLCRCGQIPFGVKELFKHRRIIRHGIDDETYSELLENSAYKRNFTRCFGDLEFDAVIDYSGYGVTQPLTLMQCRDAVRVIWQHNDLKMDLTNSAKRRTKAYRRKSATSLEALVTLYNYFDKVVSCSEGAMEINRRNLSTSDTYDKFTFATNPLNTERVCSCLENAVYSDGKYIDCAGTDREKQIVEPSDENIN